jgi:hypothetical protein
MDYVVYVPHRFQLLLLLLLVFISIRTITATTDTILIILRYSDLYTPTQLLHNNTDVYLLHSCVYTDVHS